MIITVGNLVISSFQDIGALKMNEAPTPAEINDGIRDLNMLLGSLSTEALMVLGPIMESFPLIVGQVSYTIGIGGNFNTSKPSRIDEAFIQDSLSNRYPVAITEKSIYDTYEDALISSGRPDEIVYDPGPTQQSVQLGIIYVYPITDTSGTYTLYIGEQKPFIEFAAATDIVSFHPAYVLFLRYSLDEILWSQYQDGGKPYPPKLKGLLARATERITAMNAKPSTSIVEIGKKRGGSFNIYEGPSGGGYSGV